MSEIDHLTPTGEAGSESDPVKPATGEEVKPEGTVEKPAEEPKPEGKELKKPDTPEEFEVAGQKFASLEEAIARVNTIAGDNSRLAGEVNKFNEQLKGKDTQLAEALKVIEEWNKYYESGGDKPKGSEDLKKTVQEIMEQQNKAKEDASRKDVYSKEIEELKTKSDWVSIYPEVMALANKLGDRVNEFSPLTLYKMAGGKETTKVENKSIGRALKEHEERLRAAEEAKKQVGGGKGKAISAPSDISPEVADYLKDII